MGWLRIRAGTGSSTEQPLPPQQPRALLRRLSAEISAILLVKGSNIYFGFKLVIFVLFGGGFYALPDSVPSVRCDLLS